MSPPLIPIYAVHLYTGSEENLLKIKDGSLMAIYPVRYVRVLFVIACDLKSSTAQTYTLAQCTGTNGATRGCVGFEKPCTGCMS